MKGLSLVAAAIAVLGGCHPGVSPQVLQQYQSRTLFTCCNIHYESNDINDANYYVGSTVPAGTSVTVQTMRGDSVTFLAGSTQLKLEQRYGNKQESFQQYLDKIFVTADPRQRLAGYPQAVQAAIRDGRVERGMTREQVLMSIGYPPAHRTASLNDSEWTYWYNRWVTYKVQFGPDGRVASVIGRPAPTQDQPIPAEEAKPKAAPKPPASKKKR